MAKRETCAVYIRKSTDDNKKQKYTVEKQRRWAMNTVIEFDLQNITNNGDPFIESVSAKTARKRKQYNQLIEEIQRGKVDHLVVFILIASQEIKLRQPSSLSYSDKEY